MPLCRLSLTSIIYHHEKARLKHSEVSQASIWESTDKLHSLYQKQVSWSGLNYCFDAKIPNFVYEIKETCNIYKVCTLQTIFVIFLKVIKRWEGGGGGNKGGSKIQLFFFLRATRVF